MLAVRELSSELTDLKLRQSEFEFCQSEFLDSHDAAAPAATALSFLHLSVCPCVPVRVSVCPSSVCPCVRGPCVRTSTDFGVRVLSYPLTGVTPPITGAPAN